LYLEEWRKLKPYTTGTTLQERGISPGPVYKQIFQQLTDSWIDGEIISRAEEENYLQTLINSLH